jgi:hypothetical protein
MIYYDELILIADQIDNLTNFNHETSVLTATGNQNTLEVGQTNLF